MKFNVYLGIDPGINGGICAITSIGPEVHALDRNNPKQTHEWLRKWVHLGPIFGFMEQVRGYHGEQKIKGGDRASRAFELGNSRGLLLGLIVANGMQEWIKQVPPQQWQKALEIQRPMGMTQSRWKSFLKKKACELYPDLKLTLATADALLIAHYAMALREGRLA